MRKKVGIVCIFMLMLFCGFELYFSTGMVGVTKKPNHIFVEPGCICHDRDTNVNVWIAGPESLAVGTRGFYTISLAKNSNRAGGFNVAAFFGSLELFDSTETMLMSPQPGDSLELTHTHTKLSRGRDTIAWSFWYRAPAAVGLIDTLYANGNSVDTSQDPAGDAWDFAPNFLVRIVGPNSVWEKPHAQAFTLMQNYPNPFNPSTTIQYEIAAEAHVDLRVFDVGGREVGTLETGVQSAGMHQAGFVAFNNLASGVYLYRIAVSPVGSAARYVAARKMLLVR
jgi:hypothetical protein